MGRATGAPSAAKRVDVVRTPFFITLLEVVVRTATNSRWHLQRESSSVGGVYTNGDY